MSIILWRLNVNINENSLTDSFLDISLKLGNLQINFILQTGFFDTESNWTVSSHFHSCYELHFIHEGSIELQVEDKTIILVKNDICIIPPHLNHYTKRVLEPTRKISLLFNFCNQKVNEDSGSDELSVYGGIYSGMSQVTVIRNSDIYDRYLKNIKEIFYENDISSIHKIKALFTLVFLEVSGKFTDIKAGASDYNLNSVTCKTYEEVNQSQNIRLVKIENYINNNFKNDITLNNLAIHLHLSEKQTDRILKKLTGLSFGKLLLKKRMERARELILHSEKSINEIANEIGYSSYNGFYIAFKNTYGLPPQNLRERR